MLTKTQESLTVERTEELRGHQHKSETVHQVVVGTVALWIAGAVCLAFAQGHFANPLLAVVGMACWLRMFRQLAPWLGLLAVLVGNVLAWEVSYRGMIPMPTLARFGVEAGLSIALGLCFLLDRAVYRQLPSRRLLRGVAYLVFPAAWVALDFLNTSFSPTGSWSSIAYSYVGEASLDQIASVFGWTGLTFLTGFWSVLLAEFMSPTLSPRHRGGVALAGLGVLATASIYGSLRSADLGEEPGSLRASLITTPNTYRVDKYLDQVWEYTRGYEQSDERRAQATSQIESSKNQFFDTVRQEAAAGSKLVIWAEANAIIGRARVA